MTEQKQIEALAKIEGWTKVGEWRDWNSGSIRASYCMAGLPAGKDEPEYLPDYTSHDAVQRIIDGMDGEQLCEYAREIENVVLGYLPYEIDPSVYKATPAQKSEAILKAYGKRTDENDEETEGDRAELRGEYWAESDRNGD